MRILVIIASLFLLPWSLATAQKNQALGGFAGAQIKDSVYLAFTLKGGYTCNGIVIQRSSDSVSFTSIGDIQGVCGSPVLEVDFDYYDTAPMNNTVNYYRLDLGNYGYSEVLEVYFKRLNAQGFVMSSNPCSSPCILYFENPLNKELQVQLFSHSGALLLNETIRGSTFDFNGHALATGLYRYLLTGNGELKSAGSFFVGR